MIKRSTSSDGTVKLTFAVADAGAPISLVGDLNCWDPYAHPLKKRSNGTRSVVVTVPSGSTVRFRYLTADGCFFDDPDGDLVEPNGYGQTHTVVVS